MAKECGWGFSWISENLTFSQIKRYCEAISEAKKLDMFISLQGQFLCVGAASGTIKLDKFHDFLLSIKPYSKISVEESISQMKDAGFPVEEK